MQNFCRRIIKRLTRSLGFEVFRYSHSNQLFNPQVVSLGSSNGTRGSVLLAYIIDPFLLKPGEAISNRHTHDWESLQIANTFRKLGFQVDVIDYRNYEFIPRKKYSFFVSARSYFKEIAQKLNKDCVKIAHLETSHFLFNNAASYNRCLDLQWRRGVALTSFKWVKPNSAIEFADAATIKGNKFTAETYAYAKKPFYLTDNPAVISLPWPENKNFNDCRNNFLWLGSQGFVHKGLDLVLEAFVEMPDYHLTVCGPIDKEKEFEKVFYRELYETSNIHTYGWMDVGSQEFMELANNCLGLVYPTCAEGQAGSVVNCLQVGLIPIASQQCGVDLTDFGITLKNCTVKEIQRKVQSLSIYPEKELKRLAKATWDYARENHSRRAFAEKYERIIKTIISNHQSCL